MKNIITKKIGLLALLVGLGSSNLMGATLNYSTCGSYKYGQPGGWGNSFFSIHPSNLTFSVNTNTNKITVHTTINLTQCYSSDDYGCYRGIECAGGSCRWYHNYQFTDNFMSPISCY